MKIPIYAYGGNGRSVIYEFSDGTAEMRNGGSITWRSTNPGALESGYHAKKHGSIGHNGRFAVFPDYQTGFDAAVALLKIEKYQEGSLSDAIYTYAPPSDNNDTEAYIRYVLNSSCKCNSFCR